MAKSTTATVPAPYSGLNSRDPLADMEPTQAITLDNFFPFSDNIKTRKGYTDYATGIDGVPQTLISYNGAAGDQFFAISGGSIYNISTTGPVGAALISGLANSKWQWENFGNAASNNQWIITVNGADTPYKYDGTTWSTTAFTGTKLDGTTALVPTNLINVNSYKSRLWFCEKDSLNPWYAGLFAIAGVLTQMNLAPLFKKGGYLNAIAEWAFDGFDGPQTYILFISSKGEVLMFQGDAPTDSVNWGIVGSFFMGAPLGRRCFLKAGADIIVITNDGLEPVSAFSRTDQTKPQSAITDIIHPTISDAVVNYTATFGWELVHYTKGGWILLNVPTTENSRAIQYVMNTVNGAWCSFSNMRAMTWGIFNNNLYFAGFTSNQLLSLWDEVSWDIAKWSDSGHVFKADDGFTDNGGYIQSTVETAFNYFQSPERVKRFTMLRPFIFTTSSANYDIALNTDFDRNVPTQTTPSTDSASNWDAAIWDSAPWADDITVIRPWLTAANIGYCASMYMRIQTNSATQGWALTNFVYEPGGTL